MPVAKLDKAPGYEPGDSGGSNPSGHTTTKGRHLSYALGFAFYAGSCPHSSCGRALRFERRGERFKSSWGYYAGLAHLVERRFHKAYVVGSILTSGTHWGIVQLAGHTTLTRRIGVRAPVPQLCQRGVMAAAAGLEPAVLVMWGFESPRWHHLFERRPLCRRS